ncbi:MAG: two-component regulator propeller domain-containing protein [Chitinophagaceae bacterium]
MTPKPVYIVLFVLFFNLHQDVLSQNINPRYNFKHLNVQTGLAQNIVYHFLHDSRGHMWLGTRNGLTLFDGTHTINFLNDDQNEKSIAGNFITRILEDRQDQVWIGTDVGLSRYNKNDNSFSNFNLSPSKDRMEAAFCVPLGFGEGNDLWLLETKSKTIKIFNTESLAISILTETPAVDGTLWYDSVAHTHHVWTYLSTGTIHYIFRNKTLLKKETFFSGENENLNEPILQVVHVLPKNDSVIWLSSTDGLYELNANNHKYVQYANGKSPLIKEIRFTAASPSGILWVATGNNGIYTFNPITGEFSDNFRNYRLDPFSICSNNIVSLYFDRVGNIWCGSYGEGISYTYVEKNYFQKSLSRYDLEKWNGNNNVRWIGYDKANNLWCIINNESGLWKLDNERHILEHREPIPENGKNFYGRFDKLLFNGKQHALCIGQQGLFQYDLASNRIQKLKYAFFSDDLFGSNWVQDIIRLRDQSFLFSTFSGLYRIESIHGKYVIQPFSELNKKSNIHFASLHQDELGTIYVKDGGDQLYILKRSKEQSPYRLIHTFHFLPQVSWFYNEPESNSILLATNFGLYRLSRNDNSLSKVNLETPPPFLSISCILKTDNKLWLFGEKGLFCFDEKTKRARTFTTEDGLPANEFNLSALYYFEGLCIAGTTNGMVSFFPEKLRDKIHSPIVTITNIFINDSVQGSYPNPGEQNTITLSHRQNTFSFEFAPIAFQNADECTFEYILHGYDPQWIRGGHSRSTRYSKIPPGQYIFQIRAIDPNGMVSPYEKNLKIEISKAFWQTNIFKIAVLFVILILSWLIIKWYLQRRIRMHRLEFEKQQAIEKERTRIATDMHDDLGAGLSRINFLSETIGIKKQQQLPIEEEISKIREYSHDMIDKMGEIVWALNEKNDSLSDLLSYTRAYAADYLIQNGITCKINIQEPIPDLFVSGEFRRNIFLSVKEALHNIVKHARAENVNIDITADDQLDILIRDDGIGFDKKNVRPFSNGIGNMEKRMNEIQGSFKITITPGTAILLTAPLP